VFFCDNCRQKYEWPDSRFKSNEACEMCRKQAVCNDILYKYLSMPEEIK
jgi:hypothetical protein